MKKMKVVFRLAWKIAVASRKREGSKKQLELSKALEISE